MRSAVLSPSYANVFMGNLEEKMFNSARVKPKYYKRVVVNIFMGSANLHDPYRTQHVL